MEPIFQAIQLVNDSRAAHERALLRIQSLGDSDPGEDDFAAAETAVEDTAIAGLNAEFAALAVIPETEAGAWALLELVCDVLKTWDDDIAVKAAVEAIRNSCETLRDSSGNQAR